MSGELTIWTATQGQFFVRDMVSNMLRIPETKIRVIGLELGGGFGGKIVLTQPLVATLARIVGTTLQLRMLTFQPPDLRIQPLQFGVDRPDLVALMRGLGGGLKQLGLGRRHRLHGLLDPLLQTRDLPAALIQLGL